MQLKDIPEEVKNNHKIHTYTVLNAQDKIVFQAKRLAHPDDKEQVMDGEVIRESGIYYGDWYDTTELAQAEEKKRHKSEFHKPSEVVASAKSQREKDIAQAEALLAKLRKGER